MPELPEVEIIRRELSLPLLGERIVDIEIDDKKIQIHSMDILNKVITDLIRKGKYLFLIFNDSSSLLFHMGMTGSLISVSYTHLDVYKRQDIQWIIKRKCAH